MFIFFRPPTPERLPCLYLFNAQSVPQDTLCTCQFGKRNVIFYDRADIVQLYAIRAIGNFKDSRSLVPLLEFLKDEEWRIRREAILSLGKVGDQRSVTSLIDTLKDSNEEVRAASAVALGQIGDIAAMVPLSLRLNDKFSVVRASAAKALGELGVRDAVPYLRGALKTEESIITKRAIEEALKKLGIY